MRMKRHEFLSELHRVYRPRNYLEIGVNDGRSLTLSRVPTIAVDPAFKVTSELQCDLQLVKATSDAFFKRKDPLAHLRVGRYRFRRLSRWDLSLLFAKPTLELSFIDGMHLFEFALRDFINIEKHSNWSSLIVLDDMLPRSVDEAARDRHTDAWTGDVYKVAEVLGRFRPDLVVVPVDTAPTGMVLVFGADPSNTVLPASLGQILDEYVIPDPQAVPTDVLERKRAVRPEAVIAAPFWHELAVARALRRGRKTWDELKPQVEALLA
jgi:hypothetical protein